MAKPDTSRRHRTGNRGKTAKKDQGKPLVSQLGAISVAFPPSKLITSTTLMNQTKRVKEGLKSGPYRKIRLLPNAVEKTLSEKSDSLAQKAAIFVRNINDSYLHNMMVKNSLSESELSTISRNINRLAAVAVAHISHRQAFEQADSKNLSKHSHPKLPSEFFSVTRKLILLGKCLQDKRYQLSENVVKSLNYFYDTVFRDGESGPGKLARNLTTDSHSMLIVAPTVYPVPPTATHTGTGQQSATADGTSQQSDTADGTSQQSDTADGTSQQSDTADRTDHIGTADRTDHIGTTDGTDHIGTADRTDHIGTADRTDHIGTADENTTGTGQQSATTDGTDQQSATTDGTADENTTGTGQQSATTDGTDQQSATTDGTADRTDHIGTADENTTGTGQQSATTDGTADGTDQQSATTDGTADGTGQQSNKIRKEIEEISKKIEEISKKIGERIKETSVGIRQARATVHGTQEPGLRYTHSTLSSSLRTLSRAGSDVLEKNKKLRSQSIDSHSVRVDLKQYQEEFERLRQDPNPDLSTVQALLNNFKTLENKLYPDSSRTRN